MKQTPIYEAVMTELDFDPEGIVRRGAEWYVEQNAKWRSKVDAKIAKTVKRRGGTRGKKR